MTLSHFESLGLLPFCGRMELRFVNFYYGTNPGHWKSSLPHARLLFILASDGRSTFSDAKKCCQAKKGTWILIPPFHEITHDHNDSMEHLSIHFTLNLSGGWDLFQRKEDFSCGFAPERTRQICEEIRRQDLVRMSAMMQELCWETLPLVLCAKDLFEYTLLAGNLAYGKLFDTLRRRATARMRVEDMAGLFGMSRESFVKKFTREIKIPPGKFLNRLLTVRAAQMLGNAQSVKETADQLGFCSAFYFSRFFRRQTGLAPRDYRNRFQGGEVAPAFPLNASRPAGRLPANSESAVENSGSDNLPW